MRQETILKTYLNFSELSQDQKNKVLEKMSDINVDHEFWHDFITGDFTEKLKSLGYSNIKPYFSGFWSQGDGACFTANHGENEITHSGHYYHEYSMNCDNSKLLEESRELAREYYRDLQKNYEYLTSERAIIETIESNDYEFDSTNNNGVL